MTNQTPDDRHLPKVSSGTECYKKGNALVIHEPDNENAWIAAKPVPVRR